MSSVLKLALILLAATILALGARVMYVSSHNAVAQAQPEPQILVAAADLPAGLLLRDADLGWKTLPKSERPDGALLQGTPAAAVSGALLRHPLKAGNALLAADLIRPDTPGFLAAALKPGMRAVSVPVDDVSGNAGLIQPGDYVDMILTQHLGPRGDLDAAGIRRVVSETVVEHARIIAVGSSFQRDTDASKSSRARTVTIEVSPRAAEAVTVAAQIGSLSLALRSFAVADRNAAQVSAEQAGASVVAWENRPHGAISGPVWGSDVSRVLDRREAPAPSQAAEPNSNNPRRLLILRGGQKQEQELDTHAQ
jgi:pilus assembly protein CpaB